MSRIDKDGNMHGRIGNTVYYVKNGKQYGRIYQGKVDQPNTKMQQAQKEKVALCGKFTSEIKSIINIGYQASTFSHSSLEANSYHIQNAIKEVEVFEGEVRKTIQEIDYTKTKVSRGLIDKPELLAIELLEHGIRLTWSKKLGSINTRFFDTLVALLYTPGIKAHQVHNIGTRDSGGGILEFPLNVNNKMHIWVFWHNPNKAQGQSLENISDSLYLGEFQL